MYQNRISILQSRLMDFSSTSVMKFLLWLNSKKTWKREIERKTWWFSLVKMDLKWMMCQTSETKQQVSTWKVWEDDGRWDWAVRCGGQIPYKFQCFLASVRWTAFSMDSTTQFITSTGSSFFRCCHLIGPIGYPFVATPLMCVYKFSLTPRRGSFVIYGRGMGPSPLTDPVTWRQRCEPCPLPSYLTRLHWVTELPTSQVNLGVFLSEAFAHHANSELVDLSREYECLGIRWYQVIPYCGY